MIALIRKQTLFIMMNERDDKALPQTSESSAPNDRQQKQIINKPRATIRKQKAINVALASDPADSTTKVGHLEHINISSNVNNKFNIRTPTELGLINSPPIHAHHSIVNDSVDSVDSAHTQSIATTQSSSSSTSVTAGPTSNVNPNASVIGYPRQTISSMPSLSPGIFDESRQEEHLHQQQLSVSSSTLRNKTSLAKIYEHASITPTTTIETTPTAEPALMKTGKHSLSGTSHNIPNVFFTRPQSSEEHEDNVAAHRENNNLDEVLKGCNQGLELKLKQHRKSTSRLFHSNHIPQVQADQVQMLPNSPIVHEPACRSASSSPRIARSNNVNPIVESGGQLAYSLNVPTAAAGRKLSLQPIIHQQQQQQRQQQPQPQHHHHQQQQVSSRSREFLEINNSNPFSSSNTSLGNIPQILNSSNNLTISSQHLAPRKSVIGRLERSSFQAQRLSDVGVAFGQQITAKMGLKLPASQERIVEQTRWLYLRYVFVKLRLNSLPLRDLNLTKSSRARRAAALEGTIVEATSRISNSAPVTASAMTPDIVTSNFQFARKRTALSRNIDTQDLNLLATRVNSAAKSKNEESPFSESSYDTNSIGTITANITSTNGRRYIMDPTINNQIFTVILTIVKELRDRKPEFYGDTIYELIGIDKFSSIQDLLDVQMTICQEMTRSEISWCRIIALFSLFGAISLDCVRLGTPEHVGPILDGFIEFVERDLALWISQQGGWESFLYKYRAGFRFGQVGSKVLIVALPVLIWILISMFK